MKKKDELNILIRDKRVELGLSQHDLADCCGMNKNEYREFEDYDDEIYMVVQLSKIECICNKLGIAIDDLFGFPCNDDGLLPKDIVEKKMEEKRISDARLSDLVGIEESYIRKIKDDIVNIGDWVMDPILSLTNVLEIHVGNLLKSYVEYRRLKKNGVTH